MTSVYGIKDKIKNVQNINQRHDNYGILKEPSWDNNLQLQKGVNIVFIPPPPPNNPDFRSHNSSHTTVWKVTWWRAAWSSSILDSSIKQVKI